MAEDNNQGTTLTTIENAFDIVEWIQEEDGARVSEVADRFDMPKSTAHNYLSTLQKRDYLIREGDQYRISLYFLCLGGHAAAREQVFQRSRLKVQELAKETSERAQFIAEENGQGIYVHESMGEHAVQTDVRIGKRSYLHTLSAGKAILAHLPDARVEEIIDKVGLPARTENTITTRGELFSCLNKIKERSFAFNDEERIDGQRAVGVAILNSQDQPIGALSVSGPTYRLQDEWYRTEVPNLLLGVKNELELNLAYS